MTKTKIGVAGELMRAAAGNGSGARSSEIPQILAKMGTFARKVAIKEYGVDETVVNQSGMVFPLIGVNHVVTRGIFQVIERMQNGITAGPEELKTAGSAAEKALEDPDFFFKKIEDHLTENGVTAVKNCVGISSKLTDAEINNTNLKNVLNQSELTTAELALRSLSSAFSNLAEQYPNEAGIQKFAEDMVQVQIYYSAMAQKLLPTLSTAPKAGKKS